MNILEQRIKRALFEFNIESQIEEEYPVTWNIDEFKSLRSYNKRILYCKNNLQRISSGSARIVYKIDDTKVLKLAKNSRGIAQNETEIQWKNDGYYGEILANVLDNDDNGLWVEMELARRVTPSIFKNHFGFSFDEFSSYLRNEMNFEGSNKERRMIELKDLELLDESEFINRILNFMRDSDAPVGDFRRLSSYGYVTRYKQPEIVLIDFGITSDIYDSYYK